MFKKTEKKKPSGNKKVPEAEKFKKEQAKRLDNVLKKLERRNLWPKRNKRWRNFKTTVVLLFILGFSALGLYMSFNLYYFINEMMAPQARLLMLTVFAVFMQVVAVIIWDDLLGRVDEDYFLPVLSYIGFWSFIVCGLLTYAVFLAFCAWQHLQHGLQWHFALFPMAFGTLLLASFAYKIFNLFEEN